MASRSWDTVVSEHLEVVQLLRAQAALLDQIAAALLACFREHHRVYVFGNGGSAADAQHIAAELLGRFKSERQPLPALALTTDSSTLTAIGNDYGFEQVFARQLLALAGPGDLAWAISTSGKSPNILAGIDAARGRGARVIGFSGQTGGQMAGRCDWLLRAPHSNSDRIQEAHLLAYHYLCERLEAP